ncbi:MAG TPA: nucleoside deaminase [Spirochaetota bacterium]|nr:nucleoside deaminase [Spirochaetota bacterium]HOR45415.1 nucleoside deaminase [Spirochaetota bacterium]HPK57008.1 nucleoside deaminase [Spirochaetota bacterium]
MISAEIINSLINLQRSAVASANPPFSALIVADGNIISACHNVSRSSGNPLEHAEMSAIQSVVKNHGSAILKNAHLISSNEPCPMCIGACIWSGISEVTYFISQEQVEAVRGWGRFMPARSIAEADDSGIVVNGPIENEMMLQMHRDFWSNGSNSAFKYSIHLADK